MIDVLEVVYTDDLRVPERTADVAVKASGTVFRGCRNLKSAVRGTVAGGSEVPLTDDDGAIRAVGQFEL